MIEHELSFIFSQKAAEEVLAASGIEKKDTGADITDYYLQPDLRIRHKIGPYCQQQSYILTRKSGDKSTGSRVEKEDEIGVVANLLIPDAKLVVKKRRFRLNTAMQDVAVTLDIVSAPMQLAIFEVESSEHPVDLDEVRNAIFGGVNVKPCPLSAFPFFRRKVGICGGPSSGKSETAKLISHMLNTQYGANAWAVSEYATSFIQKYDRNPTFNDQLMIFYAQQARERDAGNANVVISDCPTLLAYIYAVYGNREKISSYSAMMLSKIYKRALFDVQTYSDIIFMQQMGYVENGVRYQNATEAEKLSGRIKDFLEDHQIPHRSATYNDAEAILKDLFFINR